MVFEGCILRIKGRDIHKLWVICVSQKGFLAKEGFFVILISWTRPCSLWSKIPPSTRGETGANPVGPALKTFAVMRGFLILFENFVI